MTTPKNRETEIRDAIENLRQAQATLDAADIAGKRAFAAKLAAEADLDAARLAYIAASEAAKLAAVAFPECLPDRPPSPDGDVLAWSARLRAVVWDLSKPPATPTPKKTAN